jgi:anti-sigma factor RsiW
MSDDLRVEENELHAYVDGALTPERSAAVESYLHANPEAVRRVDEYRRQNALLRATLDPMLNEPASSSLWLRPVRPDAARWVRYGGVVASLLVAALLGWFARGEMPDRVDFGETLAQRALVAHLVYAPEVLHPVDVGARQEQHLVGWLSKRLGVPVRAPDLDAAGFALVGGRLLPGQDRPAAQFMYQDPQGRRLTLYVAVNTEDAHATAFRYAKEDDVSTFYWIEGRLGYALSGELEREPLLRVAEAVYRQFTR